MFGYFVSRKFFHVGWLSQEKNMRKIRQHFFQKQQNHKLDLYFILNENIVFLLLLLIARLVYRALASIQLD